jgi:cytochrome c-type biogenesis protein CcmE
MKKIHIVFLILIVAALAGMSFFIKDLTTYETFNSAQQKTNKFVVVKVDHDGNKSKVIYKNAKPTDIEKSEGIDLNGYMRDGYFECTKLQMKCPSKYKDNMQQAEKNLSATTNEQ